MLINVFLSNKLSYKDIEPASNLLLTDYVIY